MKTTKLVEIFKSHWVSFLVIFFILFLVVKGCIKDNYIENDGIIATAIVFKYDYYILGKSLNKVSLGYYYVNSKRYECYSKYIIPVDSVFQIKYNPKKPGEWRQIEK